MQTPEALPVTAGSAKVSGLFQVAPLAEAEKFTSWNPPVFTHTTVSPASMVRSWGEKLRPDVDTTVPGVLHGFWAATLTAESSRATTAMLMENKGLNIMKQVG